MTDIQFSPLPPKSDYQATMDFPDAIAFIRVGGRVTKVEWGDKDIYLLMRNGHLQIHKHNGFHDLIVSDGDLTGDDWIRI